MATVLAAYASTPGALIRPVGAWSPALAAAVANFSMQQLMRADCNGGVSFYTEAQGYRVAAGPACATLRPDMVVTGAEGRPFSDGRRTIQAIVEGCRERRQVRLVLQDGGKVDVACKDISMPAEFYQADIDTALRRLTAAPPAPHLP